MGSNKLRTYTPEEKKRAVALAREVGPTRASAELGIPAGSVSAWSTRAKAAAAAAASEPLPPEPAPMPPASTTPAAPEAPAPTTPAAPTTQRARVAKIYSPSEVARALERIGQIGVRPTAAELGVSRTTLKEWERKAKRAAEGQGPAPTSGPDPRDLSADRDRRILAEWNKQNGLGPSQVRNQLRRAGLKVSVQTVRRVMEEAGYRPPKVERREHNGSYEAVRPNALWHMDFVQRYIHKQPVFVLAFIDDYSRFVTGWEMDEAERADPLIAAFEAAVARHGRPESVMHDGGSAFWAWRGASRFTRVLEEYGVDQIKVDVPQHNGKSEVFNGNLQKELFDRVTFTDVGDLRRRLGPHFHWYNHHRTHHALGGLLVPADRYFGRVEDVIRTIEAGGVGGAGADPLDLAVRVLDLFRVVSHRGKAEVWLMGRKLFETPG